MKKLLLLCAAATMSLAASAVTANELDGKTVAIMLCGNDFQYSLPVATCGTTFTKEGNFLKVSNFYDGCPRLFSVNGDKLTLQLYKGEYSSPYMPGYAYVWSLANTAQYKATIEGQTVVYMVWEYGLETETVTSVQHSAAQDGSQYAWAFNPRNSNQTILLELMDISQGTQNATIADIMAFNNFQLYAYDTNGTATEYQGSMVSDMYNVGVDIDGTQVTFKNFLNQGLAVKTDPDEVSYAPYFVKGNIDPATNTIEIPIQTIMGEVDFSFLGDGSNNDSFLGDGYIDANLPCGYWFYYLGADYYPWMIIDGSTFDKREQTAAPISGTISYDAASHTGNTRWVGHDGDCKTNAITRIELGNVGLYMSSMGDVPLQCDRTVIEAPQEATADVKLTMIKSTHYGNLGKATGMITSVANTDKVDHYDVYAVDGNYKSINDIGFVNHNTQGHRDAVLVYDGSQENDKDYAFMASYDRQPTTGDHVITYFVKTNYKPETGLEPTFHAMVPTQSSNSADELTAGDMATVTAANGIITIAGTDAPATVYSASGATVYAGTDRQIAMPAGVYVVNVAGNNFKVIL